MKNKFIASLMLLAVSVPVFAQEQVPDESKKKDETVSETYNRNGLAVVAVRRGGSLDAAVEAACATVPDKFDHNTIAIKSINGGVSRTSTDKAEGKQKLNTEQVTTLANDNKIAKSVISFIFNRQADGTMDDSLLKERGLYNATDADVLKARAAAVGGSEKLAEDYFKLIDASYFVVFDVHNAYKTQETNKKTGKVTYYYRAEATANAYLIKVDQDVLWTAWADKDSKPAEKKVARENFEKIEFGLSPEGRVDASGSCSVAAERKDKSDDAYYASAIQSAYESAIESLEKQIDAWQVRTTVNSVKPLTAKIGTKESLSNGTRYRAYSYKENNQGDLVQVKRGFVRATEIADNKTNATGDSECSKFYQISGTKNIEQGWLLKEDKDMKLGVSGDASFILQQGNGGGIRVGADIDYLIKQNTNGTALLGIANIGYLIGEEMLYSASIGASYQFRLTRMFLFSPYAEIRGAMLPDDTESYTAYAGAGLKVAWQVKYPWQVYVKAGAEYMVLDTIGLGDGLGIMAGLGVRCEFLVLHHEKYILLLFVCLTFASAFTALAGKPRRLSWSSWDNYEVCIEKVGTSGTKFIKVWGYAKKMDDAIMNAKMNAVHACLFRGLPANPSAGARIPTPAICTEPNAAEAHDEYFQAFFAPGGPYLKYVNMTTDGVPSGQDCRKVKGGYKVAIYVQVMYDNLKKQMQADNIVGSLNSIF